MQFDEDGEVVNLNERRQIVAGLIRGVHGPGQAISRPDPALETPAQAQPKPDTGNKS